MVWYLTGSKEVFQEMKKLGMDQKFTVPTFRYVYTQDNTKINRYSILNGEKIMTSCIDQPFLKDI